MTDPKWIRMVKTSKRGDIPTFVHPDGIPIRLVGAFHVRWPDGSVSKTDIKTSPVFMIKRDDTEVHGEYTYFEVPFNDMTIIYNLNEVELLVEEVNACKITARKGKAA